MTHELLAVILHERLRVGSVEKISRSSASTSFDAFDVQATQGRYFVKTAGADRLAGFKAEAHALHLLSAVKKLRVPQVLFVGKEGDLASLVLEYVEIYPHSSKSLKSLAEGLAEQHLNCTCDRFGFDMDNNLGQTPQLNAWEEDWISFFRDQRLKYLLDIVAKDDEEVAVRGYELLENLDSFFDGIEPVPSLLHGDLWRGNSGADKAGRPLVFDPAAYFGHYEAERGIMDMFGGYPKEFWDVYYSLVPKQEGWEKRLPLYTLYHALNHYKLFGPTYRPLCLKLMSSCQSAV